jgi:TolB protein
MKIIHTFCVIILLISFESFGQLKTKSITKLTNIESSYPYWSPDGNMIVFQSNRADIDNTDIYSMTSDGKNLVRLTSAEGNDELPIWSPDGKKMAFASDRERKENWQIYLIDIDGNNLTRITEFDCQGAEFAKPQWSPNGDKILCTRTKDGNVEIFLIELD